MSLIKSAIETLNLVISLQSLKGEVTPSNKNNNNKKNNKTKQKKNTTTNAPPPPPPKKKTKKNWRWNISSLLIGATLKGKEFDPFGPNI